MANASALSVLVVDDDPQILDLFEGILERDYIVHTAGSGPAAIDAVDDGIDVCLIDRRMPEMTGDEVVDRLRDGGYDQPVAMVTAVEPDFDVLDMGFDDYLVKPVPNDELIELVERLGLKRRYDGVLREYFALASKVSALRSAKSDEELGSNEDYRRTIDQLNGLKQAAKDSLERAEDAGALEELFWESFIEGRQVESTD